MSTWPVSPDGVYQADIKLHLLDVTFSMAISNMKMETGIAQHTGHHRT